MSVPTTPAELWARGDYGAPGQQHYGPGGPDPFRGIDLLITSEDLGVDQLYMVVWCLVKHDLSVHYSSLFTRYRKNGHVYLVWLYNN